MPGEDEEEEDARRRRKKNLLRVPTQKATAGTKEQEIEGRSWGGEVIDRVAGVVAVKFGECS